MRSTTHSGWRNNNNITAARIAASIADLRRRSGGPSTPPPDRVPKTTGALPPMRGRTMQPNDQVGLARTQATDNTPSARGISLVRPLGAAASILGAPAGAWVGSPVLGMIIMGIEAMVILTV